MIHPDSLHKNQETDINECMPEPTDQLNIQGPPFIKCPLSLLEDKAKGGLKAHSRLMMSIPMDSCSQAHMYHMSINSAALNHIHVLCSTWSKHYHFDYEYTHCTWMNPLLPYFLNQSGGRLASHWWI